jgi:hypothetical protein
MRDLVDGNDAVQEIIDKLGYSKAFARRVPRILMDEHTAQTTAIAAKGWSVATPNLQSRSATIEH